MKTLRTLGLLALLALTARGDDWTHWGNTNDRQRAPAEPIVAPAFHGAVATGGPALASPVAADGYLVTAGTDGIVRAFRESDRAPLWSVSAGVSIIGTPLLYRGRVFAPTTDGTLMVLRLADGALLGTVATGGAEQSSPILSGNLLYLASGFPNAALKAIDVTTLAVVWTAEFPDLIHSSPVLAGGKLVIATNSGTLAAFNPADGTPLWSTTVGGTPNASAPVVVGSSVFVLAGDTLSRVDLNPAAWGTNGSVVLTDLLGAPPGALMTEWASSSLAFAGGRVTGLVRFDYPLDQDNDGYPDSWTLREYAFAVDPSSLAVTWQQLLGDVTLGTFSEIPPLKLLPAPVSTGPSIAVASSVVPELKLLAPSTGLETSNFFLDAPCQASPFVANARLYALTRPGTLYAYEGTSVQPAAATGLTPDGVELSSTPATLDWNAVPGASTYLVRLAHDGDILMDWDFEATVNSNSVACPTLASGYLYTWGVRVRSASGAWSPWTTATFGQEVPALPPGSFTATPGPKKVSLAWTASPSTGIAGYRVTYGPTGGALPYTVNAGNVLSTVISGLLPLTSYTFELRAVDHLGYPSPPVVATATPESTITIGGVPYATLAGALAAALPGQTVEIGPDTIQIPSTLQIPRGVELRGAGALLTRIEAQGNFILVDALQGSSIRLLQLSGGSIGVQASEGAVTIMNCVIRDMSDAGVFVTGTATIVNNTIVRNGVAGVRASGVADTRNNIVQDNGVGLTGIIASKYNIVTDGYVLAVPGTGDQTAPVAFLDPPSGDWREQANQPSLDAGAPNDAYAKEPSPNGGRINVGAFGNTPDAALSPAPKLPKTGGSGGCGLTGLEVVLFLALLRRRR